MSDLQRKWAKTKLQAMANFNELDEDSKTAHAEMPDMMDDDSSSASSVSSTGTVVPSPMKSLFARPQGTGRGLEPVPWTTYFERELFLDAEDGSITYHAYLTSPVGKGPLFVTHHGGGSSGLSFAVLSAEIRKRLPNAGILSPDARGHGSTTVSVREQRRPAPGTTGEQPPVGQPEAPDLSLTTLSSDLLAVIRLTQARMKWTELPPVVLVGHSLGGAVVTEVAMRSCGGGNGVDESLLAPPRLLGYAVLDVVEGSAVEALNSMGQYLATRPAGFATLRDAVAWHVRSRTIRNSLSARTSVPALLVKNDDDETVGVGNEGCTPAPGEDRDGQDGGGATSKRAWRWRTDLAATKPFWEGWYTGLSKKFLGAKGGKLLLLAGTDRLDTELTIGQMQGKYALQVFPEAGHFIHEDLPEKTAMTLVDFYRRNDRGALVLPPKVGDLLAQGKKV